MKVYQIRNIFFLSYLVNTVHNTSVGQSIHLRVWELLLKSGLNVFDRCDEECGVGSCADQCPLLEIS